MIRSRVVEKIELKIRHEGLAFLDSSSPKTRCTPVPDEAERTRESAQNLGVSSCGGARKQHVPTPPHEHSASIRLISAKLEVLLRVHRSRGVCLSAEEQGNVRWVQFGE